jgi:hypothetical protein
MSKRYFAVTLFVLAVAAPVFAQPRNDDQAPPAHGSVIQMVISKILKLMKLDDPVITVPNP